MENKTFKALMLVLVLVYVVAPDLLPGPVDDMIVMALGYFMTTIKGKSNVIDPEEII